MESMAVMKRVLLSLPAKVMLVTPRWGTGMVPKAFAGFVEDEDALAGDVEVAGGV